MLARSLGRQILAAVYDRQHLDSVVADPRHDSIWRLNEFAGVGVSRLAHPTAGLGELLDLAQTKHDAFEHLLCVDGRRAADMLGSSH